LHQAAFASLPHLVVHPLKKSGVAGMSQAQEKSECKKGN
jgi:hypothetical protein